ncbi:hypothetical protein AALA46_06895 [Enterocloster aldenensis]|uniref:hypothetical protein n=1 Tax=Enterocloster aldenensis TaxID=358742 RepID=UPI003515FBF0
MKDYNKNEYNREYNKDTYKTVKVYIREEEYPEVIEHMKTRGYTKLSGYIKDLIAQDMERTGEKSIHIQNSNGIIVGDNKGKVIVGDINGNITM